MLFLPKLRERVSKRRTGKNQGQTRSTVCVDHEHLALVSLNKLIDFWITEGASAINNTSLLMMMI